MGWESARRRPASGQPGAGAFTPRPDPRPEPFVDRTVYATAEEIETCRHYHKALTNLANEDWRFQPNLNTFNKWTLAQQLKWIYAIEQQALDGLDTIGIHVVARVVINRLD